MSITEELAAALAERLLSALSNDGVSGQHLDWSGPGGSESMLAAMTPVLVGYLSASPSPMVGDEEIVEAMIVAANDVLNEDDEDHAGSMRAALAAIAPLISRAARDRALDQAAVLREAAQELAEYASYAEIVGGLSINRHQIREWCDKVFDALRALDKDTPDV